ncbi:hypothetical protein PMIN07_005999 [Paraphaeosphaeria minitans]|uniref:Acylphosphatase n=1 Tax=Paraphaeosphaeria minitans TaxID=565426 RepID=A0A9P6KNS1_9PLEO|nr:acylphosphatase [Paraphaeosphaeria minitans]
MADRRIAFKVDGEVQGVNFRCEQLLLAASPRLTHPPRSFTTKKAQSLGVTGFVANASDGTVQGEAQGSSETIKEFVQHLNKGPSAASVSGLEQKDIATKSGEIGFNVK